MELSCPQKLNKIFLNFLASTKLINSFYKTPLGETGCLSNLYFSLAAQASSFLNHRLSQTQSTRTPLIPYHFLCKGRYASPLVINYSTRNPS